MWYMTQERKQIQKMAREFAQQEVAPFVREMEAHDTYPHEIMKKAGQLGITGLILPESCGGYGPKWVEFGICLEEIGKESNVAANALASQYAGTSLLTVLGNQKAIEEVIQPIARGEFIMATAQCEPAGQTMPHLYKTHFDWDPKTGEIIINGSKIFCTNAGEAEWYLVMCKTAVPYQPPMGEFSYILVHKDTPGFEVGHIENKIGWHGSATGQLYFHDCRVPAENLMLSMDMSPEMTYMGGGNIGVLVAAGALGAAEGVYEKTLKYARERMHGDKSLFDSYQAMRVKFAGLWMKIQELKSLVYGTLSAIDQQDPEAVNLGWACKYKGAEVFEEVASECVTLCGGNGVIVENGIERYLRDAKINSIACFSVHHIEDMLANHLQRKGVKKWL